MRGYIVFDNEGITFDRYTLVDLGSGNVFAAGGHTKEGAISGWYCGNCTDHRITLGDAGWRQMPLSRKVIEMETANYVRNAQLNPSWLGKELPRMQWPAHLHDYVAGLEQPSQLPRNSRRTVAVSSGFSSGKK
jgi:hypothetical protein